MKLFEDHPRILMFSLIFLLYAFLADIGTSMWADRYFPLLGEATKALTDINTGRYVVGLSFLNFFPILLLFVPFAWALQKAFKSWALTSLPFWAAGADFGMAAGTNLVNIVRAFIFTNYSF